jgi:hypothetical protein
MGLPTSREYTAGPGSPIQSNAFNILQDCVIGHKRPTFTRTFYPKFMLAGGFVLGNNPVNASFQQSYNSAGAVNPAYFDIPFEDGDVLVDVKYSAAGNGVTDMTNGVVIHAPSSGVVTTALASWADNNRAAAWGVVDVSALVTFTPQLLVAGASLYVQLVTNAAGYSIGVCQAVFTRL